MSKVTQQQAESTTTALVPYTGTIEWHREAAGSMVRAARRYMRTALGANEAALAIAELPEEGEQRRVRWALGQAMENLSAIENELDGLVRLAERASPAAATKKPAKAKS